MNTFLTKSEQVIHTAKAAAYVIDHQKEVSLNVKEMQYLAMRYTEYHN